MARGHNYNYNYVFNMKCFTIMSVLALLIILGCTPNPIIIERNITINRTINHTIYITNTTIEPCNVTKVNTSFDRSYTLELIRRIKFLEGQQDKYWNNSECSWELNKSNYELEECEEELCEFNSTWC